MTMQPQAIKDYRIFLSDVLSDRRKRNPSYSIRAFARSLGISHSAVSQILSGKRPLSKKSANLVSESLGLDPHRRAELLKLVSGRSKNSQSDPDFVDDDTFEVLQMDKFHFISQWYYYAILSLLEVPGSKADPTWLAERLEIPKKDAKAALDRLIRLGIVEQQEDRLVQTGKQITTTADVFDPALRNFQRQFIQKASEALDRAPLGKRDYSIMTMAIEVDKIAQAKKEITRFRRRLCKMLESGKKENVYTLAIQLFPLEEV